MTQQGKGLSMLAGIFTVGGWTMISRILGFARDILIVGLLGTGPLYEAYVVGFRLPNLFRRFFAEGAFNTAFVPMFSKRLEAGDDAEGFAQDAMAGLALVLLGLTLVAQLVMPWLIYAMASGFQGSKTFDLSVQFGRIAFPYILFISLAALASGALNALGRFAAAAAAPVLLNIFFLTAIGGALLVEGSVAHWLVWSIPFAGAAQFALVWWAVERAGIRLRPRLPRWTPEMRQLVIIAAPAALAGGVVQINLVVGQQVASHFSQAVAWLYTADRLYQLPLGVVGIAIGIVLLPQLSRRLQAGDVAGGREALSRAGEMALILTLPAAVALITIAGPMVATMFERGRFTAADTAATALAVAIYGAGLPAFVLQKVLQPLFFARGDTRTPFHYAVVSMIVNAGLAIGLAPVLGWYAPAIAASGAAWMMVALLIRGKRQFGDAAQFDTRFHRTLPRIVIASIAMGGVLLAARYGLADYFAPGWMRIPALFVLIMAGLVSFAAFGQLTGAFNLRDLRRQLSRGT